MANWLELYTPGDSTLALLARSYRDAAQGHAEHAAEDRQSVADELAIILQKAADVEGARAQVQENQGLVAADREQTGQDRIQTGLDRTQTGLDRAATAQRVSQAEAAFALASGGFVGPMVTAGGYHLTTIIYAANGGTIVGGYDIQGRLIAFDGSVFGPVGGVSNAQVQAAIGYTPANVTDAAMFAGPLVTAGGYHLVAASYDPQRRVVGGITVDGDAVGVVDGVLSLLGSGGGNSVQPATLYSLGAGTGTVATNDGGAMLLIVGLGQSLARAQLNVPGNVSLTQAPLDPGFSLMFDAGVIPDGATVTGFTDLANPAGFETAGPRMFGAIQTRLQADLGFKTRMIWAVAAQDGAPYLQLKRGSSRYAEALRLVERAATFARLQGRRLITHFWLRHGEADVWSLPEQYAQNLIDWRRDLVEDVTRITAQREPVRLFVTQPVRGSSGAGGPAGSGIGMVMASERDPNIVLLGPVYMAKHDAADSAHPDVDGYVMIGETSGHAMSDALFGRGWQPIRVAEAWWSAGGAAPQIGLRYTRPVTIDTSGVVVNPAGLAAAGFDMLDDTTAITISSVAEAASPLILTIAGNQLTIGPGSSTTEIRTLWGGHLGLTVTVDGARTDVLANRSTTLGDIASIIASRFAGASASGAVVTFSGTPSLTAASFTDRLVLTLATAPTRRPRLFYAGRTSGGFGSTSGARGLVREWRRLGVSAAGGSPPLHHWACVEVISLPIL